MTTDQTRNGNTGTFLSHTHIDDAGGRFSAVNAAKIVGQSPAIAAAYSAASAAHQTELPDEPPLGFDNPELESPTGVPPVFPPVATDDPAHAPSGGSLVQQPSGDLMSERAGSSPSSQTESAIGGPALSSRISPQARIPRDAGPSVSNKRSE